jgi:8-oxo-dGTP pyrophosphatase MutT (NUDIX family)
MAGQGSNPPDEGRSLAKPVSSLTPPHDAALGPRLLVVAALVWLDETTVVVQRRPPYGAHAREFELPGGKVERGEAPRAALLRELVEEWGEHAVMLRIADVCDVLHHVYPGDDHRGPGPEVVLLVYHVDARAFAPEASAWIRPPEGVELLQCDVAQLPVAEFVAADRDFIAAIRDGRVRAPAFV